MQYTNKKGQEYFLQTIEAHLRQGNRVQRIYYFTRRPEAAKTCDLPKGFEVVENQKTGLPCLRKIK
jgi:hypothetical protein